MIPPWVALLSLGIAGAQAPADSPPEALPSRPAGHFTEAVPVDKKRPGTRPIPKVGVREAKSACKGEGHKGRALASCIGTKVKSP